MARQPEVIGIASGKGGVGKTSLSVNIARQMAENGKKVFLFDGDMGLANAQIALGVKARENISHVILGEKNINEIGNGKYQDLKEFSSLPDIIRGYEEVRLDTMTEYYKKSDNLFKA